MTGKVVATVVALLILFASIIAIPVAGYMLHPAVGHGILAMYGATLGFWLVIWIWS